MVGLTPRPAMSLLRRILGLALMLTTMSAPLALTLCQVECAHAASDRAAAQHHSCHEAGEPAAVSISAVPHFCGHTDDAPAGLERAPQVLLAPAASVALAAWAPPSVIVRVAAPAPQFSPPRTLALLSQLRV
jgi:hypothetical protein